LNGSDRKAFEVPPVFTEDKRTTYFNPPQWTAEFISTLRAPSSITGFVLMMGYFRAANRFFGSDKFHKTDVDFVAKAFGFKKLLQKLNSHLEKIKEIGRIIAADDLSDTKKVQSITSPIPSNRGR
jgi:hypothetical protein